HKTQIRPTRSREYHRYDGPDEHCIEKILKPLALLVAAEIQQQRQHHVECQPDEGVSFEEAALRSLHLTASTRRCDEDRALQAIEAKAERDRVQHRVNSLATVDEHGHQNGHEVDLADLFELRPCEVGRP